MLDVLPLPSGVAIFKLLSAEASDGPNAQYLKLYSNCFFVIVILRICHY